MAGPQICGKTIFRLVEWVPFSGNRTYAGTHEGKSPGDLTRAKELILSPQSVQRVLTTGWSVATTRLMIEPSSKSLRSQTLAGPQICVNRGDRPSCVQWAKSGLSNHPSGNIKGRGRGREAER